MSGEVHCSSHPDPVIAIKDLDIESKCLRYQYTKETFDLCEYFCRKHISRRKKSSTNKLVEVWKETVADGI